MIKQRLSWLLAIVVVSAVAVAALLVWLSQTSGGGEEEVRELLADVPRNDTTLGSEDTPVTSTMLPAPTCVSDACDCSVRDLRMFWKVATVSSGLPQ